MVIKYPEQPTRAGKFIMELIPEEMRGYNTQILVAAIGAHIESLEDAVSDIFDNYQVRITKLEEMVMRLETENRQENRMK